jgi:carbonic anhydrase
LAAAVREHVLVQIENLQTHPAVAVQLQRGELTLHAWIYRMQTGEVLAYSSDDGKFTALTSLPPEEAGKRKVSNPRQAKKK